MRILHVITKLELGGAQQNTLFTCRRLAEAGHEVVLASGPGGRLDAEAARGPFRHEVIRTLVRPIAPWRDLRTVWALRRLIRSSRPDIVHTHSSKAGALGRLAARLAGARAVVHTVHGWSFSENHPPLARRIYRVVERVCSPLTDRFISVSARDLETGHRLGIVPDDRGVVIRSGIDMTRFRPDGPGRQELRTQWRVRDSDVVVVNVSCLKPQKAPLDFVRAAAQASLRAPALFFVLVGDGVLRREVEDEVRRQGLDDRFLLTGWREDVPEILRAADVVALTSLWEGLPRAAVQARVSGRPLVATAVNGTPEAVEAGVTGLLRPARDVEGLAKDLARLATDDALRRRMGQAAAESADFRAEFDEEEMVRRQLALYEELVGSG